MQTATDIVFIPAVRILPGDLVSFRGELPLRVEAVDLRRDCHGLITIRGEGRAVAVKPDRHFEVERAVDSTGTCIGMEEE